MTTPAPPKHPKSGSQLGLVPRILVPDAKAHGAFLASAFGLRTVFEFPTEAGMMHRAMLYVPSDAASSAADDASAPAHAVYNEDIAASFDLDTPARAAVTALGHAVSPHMNVADADAASARMTSAGASIVAAVETKPWGSKMGSLRDPEGVLWTLYEAPDAKETGGGRKLDKAEERTVAMQISVRDARKYIDFLCAAVGGTVLGDIMFNGAKTKVLHAEVQIAGGLLMISDLDDDTCAADKPDDKAASGTTSDDKERDATKPDDTEARGTKPDATTPDDTKPDDATTPADKEPTPCNPTPGVNLIVLEVPHGLGRAVEARAAAAGATITMPVAKQFWGATFGTLRDPQGVAWGISEPQPKPEDEPSPDVLAANATIGERRKWRNVAPVERIAAPTWVVAGTARDALPMPEFKLFFGPAFAGSRAVIEAAGAAPNAGPIGVYRKVVHPAADGSVKVMTADITAGFPFDAAATAAVTAAATAANTAAAEGEPRFAVETFGGEPKCLHATHRGAYEKLPDTYATMVEFAAELGVALSGVGYEHYTSMPDAKPEDMTTEIYLPIQAAKKKE
eukprot:TRINITY_DN1536_c0_g1_i4.p1 TRINITY_DN1536_c0_g1~~TRINITY_DN1536_c0_g1_i4.p1  ORF type:complete len:567 (+),score=137.60 TRINITY_DN1536_c0_g1_i4:138-1838(+)